jgi:hypothetical protein
MVELCLAVVFESVTAVAFESVFCSKIREIIFFYFLKIILKIYYFSWKFYFCTSIPPHILHGID